MSPEHDAALVRRYAKLLRDGRAPCGAPWDDAIVDHQYEILWAFARAVADGPLPPHLSVLRRVSLALLDDGGRRLCDRAERLAALGADGDCAEASGLRELGCALIELGRRHEQQC